ncbi:MAG: sigma-70 family RNA polymerase sigma factor, partial [Lapillicoccus sp.]
LVTPILWHTVRAQRVGHDQAEDIVQTTWLRLVHHAEAVQDPRAVLAWLIVTAKRESWRIVRDARRTQPLPDYEEADPAPEATLDGPETAALATLEGRVLWRHIEALPERCRSLLRVVAFSDRPDYAAVADALGMPVGSIGPTRGRCLAKLRLLLDTDPHWGTS